MAVMRIPISVDTKVSAPRMSAAPIDAKRTPSQDMNLVPLWNVARGQPKVSRPPPLAASRHPLQPFTKVPSMRVSIALLAASLFVATPVASQSPDSARAHADHAVRGGGALPPGWSARPDGDGDLKSVKFVTMEPGYHLTLGPATILYREADLVDGPFHAMATFHQMKKLEHAEGYGLFFGGQSLKADGQKYTYFLVRDDGTYLIKQRDGEKTTELTKGWTAHSAVKKGDAQGKTKNLVEIDAKQNPRRVDFKVNGKIVHTADAKSMRLNGVIGLRANHNLDLHVEGFGVHK